MGGLSSGPSENKDLNVPPIVTFPYGLRINVKTQNTANFITFKPKVYRILSCPCNIINISLELKLIVHTKITMVTKTVSSKYLLLSNK